VITLPLARQWSNWQIHGDGCQALFAGKAFAREIHAARAQANGVDADLSGGKACRITAGRSAREHQHLSAAIGVQ
jgi:hypothetical protein